MTAKFDAAIREFNPPLPLAIAFSGGADSTALLVAASRKWPGQVSAIHVNHGLQAAAAKFEDQCQRACAVLPVTLHSEHVDARHEPGESPEDAARRARYAAIHAAALRVGVRGVALAQHADDQVETLLLALSRGAGLAGLSGMRASWSHGGIAYCRPLLAVPGEELREWLRAQGVAWIEDPSNANEQFTRNRIRQHVLPAIASALPQYRDTFARSARHAAQAQVLLDEVAAIDLEATGTPPAIDALRAVTRERQANLLRFWLKSVSGQQASAAQMDELLDQVAACSTRGHDIQLRVGAGFVRRDAGRLGFTRSV